MRAASRYAESRTASSIPSSTRPSRKNSLPSQGKTPYRRQGKSAYRAAGKPSYRGEGKGAYREREKLLDICNDANTYASETTASSALDVAESDYPTYEDIMEYAQSSSLRLSQTQAITQKDVEAEISVYDKIDQAYDGVADYGSMAVAGLGAIAGIVDANRELRRKRKE